METNKILNLTKTFEESKQTEEGIEFWYARDLQELLGYSKWENFIKVIEKAQNACKNSKQDILDHFPEVRKTIELGSGSERAYSNIQKLNTIPFFLHKRKQYNITNTFRIS